MQKLEVPYYPVVTAGWDSSPRTVQSDVYRFGNYPFLPIMETDIDGFRSLLEHLAALLKDRRDEEKILFFNAWNEWTEGSYLEPDTFNEFKLLDALKNFRENSSSQHRD